MILNIEFGLIWTTPWPDEKEFFLRFSKIRNSWNSQNSVWKTIFFSRQAIPKTFLLYPLIRLVILNAEFGLIWTTPWPAEKEFFLKFSNIRNSRNSQNCVWKPNFFLGNIYQKFFCFTLSLHWWCSILRLVRFGQLLEPMKKNFLRILNNSQFAKSAKFRMKSHFFLEKLYQQLFCFTLSIHSRYSIPSLVWFGQSLDPMKKTFFLKKLLLREFKKVLIENPTFFLGKLSQYFLRYTIITMVILNTEFGLISTTPWPDEKKNFWNSQRFAIRKIRKIPYENRMKTFS